MRNGGVEKEKKKQWGRRRESQTPSRREMDRPDNKCNYVPRAVRGYVWKSPNESGHNKQTEANQMD